MLAGMTPRVEAVVICDAVHRDPGTGKHTLLGTFSAAGGPEFPVVVGQLAVFVVLSGIRSKIAVSLQIVRLHPEDGGETEVFRINEIEIQSPSPRDTVEWTTNATGLAFPEPGEYRIRIVHDGESIADKRVSLIQVRL